MKKCYLTIHNGKFCAQFRITGQGQKTRSTGFAAVESNRHKAEKKAWEIYINCLKEAEAGIIGNNTLLCDYIKDFVNRRQDEVAPTTYYNDLHYLNKHIYPYFEKTKLKLKDVKPRDIENYWKDKCKDGLSADAALKHIRLISPALKDAVKNGYLSSNPCEYANKPKKVKPTRIAYNARELAQLLEISKGTTLELPIFLAVNYALRREEAIGLRWSDIDFDKKTMHICNTATRGLVDGKFTTILAERTKTASSTATYKLDDEVCEYLKAVKAQQEHMPRITEEYVDYVCVNQVGELLKPDYVSRAFGKLLEKNQLKKITFHELRHSCISLMVNGGRHMKEAQEYARHSNYSTTADIYSHLEENALLDAHSFISQQLNAARCCTNVVH